MALSKTQQGLALVASGMAPRLAALELGIAESTLRVAMGRIKGRDLCPCCGQVVREGFEVKDVHADAAAAERQRIVTDLERMAKKTEDNVGAGWIKGIANYLSLPKKEC